MKVVVLLPTLPVYRKDFLENLNIRLKNSGIDLVIVHGAGFFKKAIKSDTNPGYTVVPLETIEFKFLGYRIVWWKKVLRTIRTIKPEIVIILFSPGNITFSIIQFYCYLKRIEVGIWSSGFVRKEITGIRKKLRSWYLIFFLRRAKFHICYGTQYQKFLLQSGIPESKVFVAQNTINVEPVLALDIAKNKVNPDNTIEFLFVGALIREKNLDLAIRAIAKLINEGFNIRFTIIGQGVIIDNLKAVVTEEHMEKYIYVLGPKYNPELSSYFINSDIFLLPGTGGLAINEAMAYGLPILSTVGDGTVTDLVNEGENGYYLDDVGSVENIYSVCKKMLQNEKPKLTEMGRFSRQIISEKCTLGNMVTKFEEAVIYGLNK